MNKTMAPFGRFLAAVALVCVLGLAALQGFARSPAYCRHTTSYTDIPSCFQYDVRGRKVDVLFVGDSSLFHAIRPAVIERETGLTSYNFGLLGPAFSFDPGDTIDHWLANNPQPHAVVIYVSPWHLIHPGRFTDPGWFAYALLQMQHGDLAHFLKLVAARPGTLVEVPQVVSTLTGRGTGLAEARRATMFADDGHLSYTPPGQGRLPTAAEDCAAELPPAPPVIDARMRQAIADLRARYRARGLPVYFYIAPTAQCDRSLALIRRATAGVADNLPTTLPDGYFISGKPREPKHVHVNLDGEEPTSLLAGRFVADKLGTRR